VPKPRTSKPKYAVLRALVEYRQQIGMTLAQCSDRMGYSHPKQLSVIETKSPDIRMSVLFKFANALGLEFKLIVREKIPIENRTDRWGIHRNPSKINTRKVYEPGLTIGQFCSIGLDAEESLEFWENEAT